MVQNTGTQQKYKSHQDFHLAFETFFFVLDI
jgi:hypothetical protein